MSHGDWKELREIYEEGIATGTPASSWSAGAPRRVRDKSLSPRER